MMREARRPSLRTWQPVELSEYRGQTKQVDLEALFECYPQAFLQIAEYYHNSEELLRQVRAWSRFFNRFCLEDPNVARPYQEVKGIVTAIRTLLSSERARCSRLLFCCVWILLIGVVCPIMSVSWEAGFAQHSKENSKQDHASEMFASRAVPLSILGVVSLLAALCMPTSVQTADAIVSAVGRMGGDGRGSQAEQALHVVSVAIGASGKFVVRIKLGLAACSALSILVSVSPFLGSLVACFSLLAASVVQARRVGLDMKLSLQHAFRSRDAASQLSLFESEPAQNEDLDQNLLGAEPEGKDPEQEASSIRILIVTCFLICASRSMILWVSDLRGCGDGKKDVHEAICFPSLVAMVCPGFICVGSMFKICLSFIGCCEPCADCYQGGSGPQRWLAIIFTSAYLWCPVLLFASFGLLLPLKVLADIGKSPLADVFSLWRLPVWEELMIIAMVLALWLAMLLLSVVITTCVRMLKDTGWPTCLMMYAGSCMVWEVLLALLMFKNGENFLPRILVINSAVSTGVISTICIGFVIYGACQCMTCNGERPVVGYGYLWG